MTDGASREDLRFVDRLRGGDEQAFLRLVERYHPILRRLARVYVGNDVAAEELVQDTWVNLLEDIDRFDGRSTLRMWVCRLLLELARARCRELDGPASPDVEDARPHGLEPAVDRRRFRSDGHWQVPPRSFGEVPEGRSPGDALVAHAEAGVEALPRAEREVVTLRDVEGWTAGDVCGLLAISDAQQRALLQRGRSNVCAALEERVAGVPV